MFEASHGTFFPHITKKCCDSLAKVFRRRSLPWRKKHTQSHCSRNRAVFRSSFGERSRTRSSDFSEQFIGPAGNHFRQFSHSSHPSSDTSRGEAVPEIRPLQVQEYESKKTLFLTLLRHLRDLPTMEVKMGGKLNTVGRFAAEHVVEASGNLLQPRLFRVCGGVTSVRGASLFGSGRWRELRRDAKC